MEKAAWMRKQNPPKKKTGAWKQVQITNTTHRVKPTKNGQIGWEKHKAAFSKSIQENQENQEKAKEPEEQKARAKEIESKLQVYLFS